MGRKYVFKRRPFAHQVRAVKFLVKNDFGGALLMEPRTGKTKTAIDYMGITKMRDNVQKWLIVCPNRVMGVWIEAIHDDCPLRVSMTVWDKEGRKETAPPRIDGFHDLYILIINYDAFSTPGKRLASGRRSKRTGRLMTKKLIEDWVGDGPAGLILDESHRIKSPSGKAATAIVNMVWPRFRSGVLKPNAPLFVKRLLLTGTPVTKAKRCFDIYMQWQVLNPKRFASIAPTSGEFKNRYGMWTHSNGFPQWLRPTNQDELQRLVHKDAFAVLRSECYDMPPPKPRLVTFDLTGKSAEAYDQMAEEMIVELASKTGGHVVEASIPIVQVLRLHQISSGFVKTTEGKLLRIGRDKLNALEEELAVSLEHDEKVIVTARFKADISACYRLADSMGYEMFQIRGGMKREATDAAWRGFQSVDDPAVIVCQPAAASEGINLSAAGKHVWYSLTDSWVNYTQMNDRNALNPLQTEQVYLMASPTDRTMYDSLQLDGNVARYIAKRPARLLRPGAEVSEALQDALAIFHG